MRQQLPSLTPVENTADVSSTAGVVEAPWTWPASSMIERLGRLNCLASISSLTSSAPSGKTPTTEQYYQPQFPPFARSLHRLQLRSNDSNIDLSIYDRTFIPRASYQRTIPYLLPGLSAV